MSPTKPTQSPPRQSSSRSHRSVPSKSRGLSYCLYCLLTSVRPRAFGDLHNSLHGARQSFHAIPIDSSINTIPSLFPQLLHSLETYLSDLNPHKLESAYQKHAIRYALIHPSTFAHILLPTFFSNLNFSSLNDKMCDDLYSQFGRCLSQSTSASSNIETFSDSSS